VYNRALQEVVLVYVEDHPISFARVEKITPDHKPGWYHLKMLFLQLPMQVVTWILRDSYIDGAEFTMGGKRMRLETVVCPKDPHEATEKEEKPAKPALSNTATGAVISLADRKKK
jgi:hypothetical protein